LGQLIHEPLGAQYRVIDILDVALIQMCIARGESLHEFGLNQVDAPNSITAQCPNITHQIRDDICRVGTEPSIDASALDTRPEIAAAVAQRGVVGRAGPQGDVLGFGPPPCLTRDEADIVVSAATDAIEASSALCNQSRCRMCLDSPTSAP